MSAYTHIDTYRHTYTRIHSYAYTYTTCQVLVGGER